MKKCLILGGGIAGLTSAVYLSKAGFKVKLIEASPKLGGRAYSYFDKDLNLEIDNGQHILMGCYKETLKFLRTIDSIGNLTFQKDLTVNFLKENKNQFQLKSSNLPYPVGLITGLLSYKAITLLERLLLLKFFIKLPFQAIKDLENLTVLEWLERENQNEMTRKAFWNFIAIGALNTSLNKASARSLLIILKEMFLKGKNAATIILPGKGLTETYCNEAEKFIQENNGEVVLSEKVVELKVKNSKIVKVKTTTGELTDFDYVISALPFFALEKILSPAVELKKANYKYSSILSVHLKLDKNELTDKFYGLINSRIHWIFNHGDNITLVISDGDKYMELSKKEIFDLVCDELKKYAGIGKGNILNYRVIKEKRATFIPSNDIEGKRPPTETNIKNFFLTGDWIDTGLPSTIESAVKSGRMVTDKILELQGR